MKAEEINFKEFLELDSTHGLIRFAEQRALLFDATAFGLLRKYLVENFGVIAARTVLTQFGFAHGWRMAEAVKTTFDWVDQESFRKAGPKMFMLEGLFKVQAGAEDPLSPKGAMLVGSFEAEQHLLHLGQSDHAGCWTIGGLLSGYMSFSEGHEIYVLEHRCLGQGHTGCHFLGRAQKDWGEERAEDLVFFKSRGLKSCLEVSLSRVIENLNTAEEKLRSHRKALVGVLSTEEDPHGIVTRSPKMRKTIDLACRVAKADVTVLITGESGVGKELIARLIHRESARALGPFLALNCGALTESLLETELFGHRLGAFTGAISDRPGLFEAAQNGTLFLDEVGEISLNMQVKLLRVLQSREVRRVGENKSRPINLRIIAATNCDLSRSVKEGSFRQDFYYRIRVMELNVSPLRERREDILPLARKFLAEAALRMDREISGLTPRAADQLLRYPWPGNVRELENAMERGVALAEGHRLNLEDLEEDIRQAFPTPVAHGDSIQPMSVIEKEYILAVLELNDGNQTRTAQQLDISAATLYRRLKKYGMIVKGRDR